MFQEFLVSRSNTETFRFLLSSPSSSSLPRKEGFSPKRKRKKERSERNGAQERSAEARKSLCFSLSLLLFLSLTRQLFDRWLAIRKPITGVEWMCSPARVWPGPTPRITPFLRCPFVARVYSPKPTSVPSPAPGNRPSLGDLLINHSPVIAIDERLCRASLGALSAHGGIRQISWRLYRWIIDRTLLDRLVPRCN